MDSRWLLLEYSVMPGYVQCSNFQASTVLCRPYMQSQLYRFASSSLVCQQLLLGTCNMTAYHKGIHKCTHVSIDVVLVCHASRRFSCWCGSGCISCQVHVHEAVCHTAPGNCLHSGRCGCILLAQAIHIPCVDWCGRFDFSVLVIVQTGATFKIHGKCQT